MPRYVRVKDPETKHEFDISEGHRLLRLGLVTRIKSDRYPPWHTQRRPKHHLNLAGQSATRTKPKPSGEGQATTEEN